MNHSELSIKTTIQDLETKLDKNQNLYFKLTLRGFSNYFYAFSYKFPEKTWQTLKERPEQFINQLVLITYQELPNLDGQGTFFKVKAIEIVP